TRAHLRRRASVSPDSATCAGSIPGPTPYRRAAFEAARITRSVPTPQQRSARNCVDQRPGSLEENEDDEEDGQERGGHERGLAAMREDPRGLERVEKEKGRDQEG